MGSTKNLVYNTRLSNEKSPSYNQKLRIQLIKDQELLMANHNSNKKKAHTFGSLLPLINEPGKALNKNPRPNYAADNLKLTDLLESIRKRGSKERMEFISKRMGALRGDEKIEANSLLNIIKKNIRARNHPGNDHLKSQKPSMISNLSNLLDLSGKRSFKAIEKDEGVVKHLAKGLRFISKIEDNDMLKLLNVNDKCVNFLLKKNSETGGKKVQTIPAFINTSLPRYIEENAGTFMFLGDRHVAIRNYLVNKGWTEKFNTPEEYASMRRILQNPVKNQLEEPANLIWLNGWLNWSGLSPKVIVSRIPTNCPFTKTNLSIGMKSTLPFIYEKNEINARVPRTYEIRIEGDMKNFQKHYRINACLCLLKKFVSTMPTAILSPDGLVPLETVDFAVKRIIELLQLVQHDDLDEWNFSVVKDSEWETYLLRFYDIVHYDVKFQSNTTIDINKLTLCCKKLLEMAYRVFPEMKYEGVKNLWICKPANGSCGRGVRVFRKLKEIEQHCAVSNAYVIQKYIEMPLLVYNTKFDIRQWFIISSVSPLILWMYEECYLRFCSQEFCLSNLHESVHLCNNTIQWKYKNGVRSAKLPHENMWDNYEFSEFLKKEIKQDQWPNIHDQMRQAIIAACVATQDRMFHRANSFQLFGADFMLTPDFKVWLIEINSQPAMKYSTNVTSRMCRAVLEDTVKIGLLRKNETTIKRVGKFREIYRQKSEYPKTVIPSTGIVHSKKSSFLPNVPYYQNDEVYSETTEKTNKIFYENLATYKNHPKVQIKPKVNSDRPLYPGDSTQSIVEDNVVLNDNSTGREESSKPLCSRVESIKCIKEKTEKDGERITSLKCTNKNEVPTFLEQIEDESRTLDEINSQNDDQDSTHSTTVLYSTKRAISTLKLFQNFMKKELPLYFNYENNEKDGNDDFILSSALLNNSGLVSNLLCDCLEENKCIDFLKEKEESIANIHVNEVLYNKTLSLEGYAKCNRKENESVSSWDDLYTHDIITGKELLPELSGYAFIGESGDDRKLECVLNSAEFLNCIGKTQEKIKPIFQSFVKDQLCK